MPQRDSPVELCHCYA